MRSIAIDTETTGTRLFHVSKPFAVSLLDEDGNNWFWEWPVNYYTRDPSYPPDFMAEFLRVVMEYDYWVFHNAKFDIRAIQKNFGPLPDGLWKRVHDTMSMSHVLDSSDMRGLKPLALKYLGILDDDEAALRQEVIKARRTAKSNGWNRGDVIEEDYWLPKAIDENSTLLADYCIKDTHRTMGLFKLFTEILQKQDLTEFYERERKLTPVLYEMEERGITLKQHSVARTKNHTQKLADLAEITVQSVGKSFGHEDINIRSVPQMTQLLFRDIGMPCRHYTPTKRPKLNKDVLEELLEDEKIGKEGRGLVGLILRHRQATKALADIRQYVFFSRKEGGKTVLHTSLNQVGTKTTRLSSKDPNSHNVSVRAAIPLRGLFGPPKGVVWYCLDYNQIELRILSVAANEPSMLKAFEDGKDIHQWTADLCNVPRFAAKNANFAAVYGAGDKRLMAMTGVPNMGEMFYKAYPEIKEFTRQTTMQVHRRGYVNTLSGYRLYVPPERPYAGVDYVIQGTAGDILKDAMIAVSEMLQSPANRRHSSDTHMIMTIHDELVIEVPEKKDTSTGRKALVRLMEKQGRKYGVHTPVDLAIVTTDWAHPKKVEL